MSSNGTAQLRASIGASKNGGLADPMHDTVHELNLLGSCTKLA